MATALPLSPFITEPDNRFVLDVEAFMAAITGDEPLPAFLADPSDEYMRAADLRPIVDIIGRHAA